MGCDNGMSRYFACYSSPLLFQFFSFLKCYLIFTPLLSYPVFLSIISSYLWFCFSSRSLIFLFPGFNSYEYLDRISKHVRSPILHSSFMTLFIYTPKTQGKLAESNTWLTHNWRELKSEENRFNIFLLLLWWPWLRMWLNISCFIIIIFVVSARLTRGKKLITRENTQVETWIMDTDHKNSDRC